MWIGRFPNGVKGICRAYSEDSKRSTGKKDTLTYLDAAALCARSVAGRLPTLTELRTAAAAGTAVSEYFVVFGAVFLFFEN